jgi:hypothetical protein
VVVTLPLDEPLEDEPPEEEAPRFTPLELPLLELPLPPELLLAPPSSLNPLDVDEPEQAAADATSATPPKRPRTAPARKPMIAPSV